MQRLKYINLVVFSVMIVVVLTLCSSPKQYTMQEEKQILQAKLQETMYAIVQRLNFLNVQMYDAADDIRDLLQQKIDDLQNARQQILNRLDALDKATQDNWNELKFETVNWIETWEQKLKDVEW